MCGIVAVISKSKYGFNHKDMEIFENLLYIDTLRGPDSTGVFLVSNDGNVEIAKGAVDGPTFLRSEEWKAMKKKAISDGWAIVGHNRKATRGSITDENAHPFWVDDKLVLVHNGSMYGGHKHHKDVEVDSHAIAHVLAEQPDTEKALQSINAAYALIWYDVENKKLNLIRNKDRPLAHTADHNAWFITSETEIMDFVMTRASYNKQPKPSVGFPVGNMHTWTLNEDKGSTLSYQDVDHEYKFQKTYGTASQSDDEYACAYGAWGAAALYGSHGTEVVPTQTPVRNSSVLVLNPQPPEMEYYIGLKRVPEWQGTINYTTLMSLRQGQYRDNAVLRVVVEDIIAYPGYTNGDFIFVGKPRAFNQTSSVGMFDVPIIFRVDKQMAERAMAGENDTLVFYVKIMNHGWNPTNDNGQGYMTLWADDPKEVVVSSVKQQVLAQQQQQTQHSVH